MLHSYHKKFYIYQTTPPPLLNALKHVIVLCQGFEGKTFLTETVLLNLYLCLSVFLFFESLLP